MTDDSVHVARLRALGERMRTARGTTTQVDLAEKTGINQSTLSKYERGEIEPGVFSMDSIAQATRSSLAWLITGRGARHDESVRNDAPDLSSKRTRKTVAA